MQPEQLAEIVADAIATATSPLLARIATLERREAVPGRDGRDGAPGPAGERGAAGEKGETGPQGAPGPEGPVGPMGPQGEKGIDGVDGKDGRDGVDGKDGSDGLNGKDGAPGLDGKDGAPGRDGTLEHLKIVQGDDLRTIRFCFKDGTPIEGGEIRLPVLIDRGVFKVGQAYAAGDGVTWGGSFWIAQADTTAKPGDGATPWRMAVRKGADGKNGKNGVDGINGKDGKDGRDRW